MKNITKVILIVAAAAVALSACSKERPVNTEETKAYRKAVLAVERVKKVKVYHARAKLHIDLIVASDIGQDEIGQALELTKEFVTVSNMESISKHLGLSGEISQVYLEFWNKKGELLKRYTTRYFKTYRKEYTPDNLEEYKIWRDETPAH